MLALLFVLTLSVGCYAKPYSDGRIVNGTEAKLGEIPYIVPLKYNGALTCAGSILNERHILTAAHCVQGRESNPSVLSISYGTINQFDTTIDIKAEKIVYHENYAPGNGYLNDVAVIRLTKNIEFNDVTAPTKLPPYLQPTPEESDGLLAGWGRPMDSKPTVEILQTAHLLVYKDDDCERLHSHQTNRNYHVCAGVPEGGKGQCNGDSGGPLYANGVQIGIVSWSVKPCAREGYPGVYTKVSTHVEWIKEHSQI